MATNNLIREFISEEKRSYKLRLGSIIASSLAGIVCGAILASIIWAVAFNYIITIVEYPCVK